MACFSLSLTTSETFRALMSETTTCDSPDSLIRQFMGNGHHTQCMFTFRSINVISCDVMYCNNVNLNLYYSLRELHSIQGINYDEFPVFDLNLLDGQFYGSSHTCAYHLNTSFHLGRIHGWRVKTKNYSRGGLESQRLRHLIVDGRRPLPVKKSAKPKEKRQFREDMLIWQSRYDY